MKSSARPELTTAVGCSAPSSTRPDSTYKSGNVVQTNGATSHYRPKKLFPTLATEYLNLYYACNRCNSLKRDFWPSPVRVKEGSFVPNPCEHVMFEHLRYKGGSVAFVSNAGEWTVELLDLNDTSAVAFREGFIGALDALWAQIEQSKSILGDAKKKLVNASTAAKKAVIDGTIRKAEANLAELESQLKKLVG